MSCRCNAPRERARACRQRGVLRRILVEALRCSFPCRCARTARHKNLAVSTNTSRGIEARIGIRRAVQRDAVLGSTRFNTLQLGVVSRRHSTRIGCRSCRHGDTIISQAKTIRFFDFRADNICIANTNAVTFSIYVNKALNVKINMALSSSTSLGVVGVNRKVDVFLTGRESGGVASASRGLDLGRLDKVILWNIDNLANIRAVFSHLITGQIAIARLSQLNHAILCAVRHNNFKPVSGQLKRIVGVGRYVDF